MDEIGKMHKILIYQQVSTTLNSWPMANVDSIDFAINLFININVEKRMLKVMSVPISCTLCKYEC